MDSLMAVELRLALEQRVGINLPMLSLSPQTSLAMIAARLARDLTAPDAADRAMGDLESMVARHEAVDDTPVRVAAP